MPERVQVAPAPSRAPRRDRSAVGGGAGRSTSAHRAFVQGARRLAVGVALDPAVGRVGRVAVMPASSSACELTHALWPSRFGRNTGRSGTIASSALFVGQSPGERVHRPSAAEDPLLVGVLGRRRSRSIAQVVLLRIAGRAGRTGACRARRRPGGRARPGTREGASSRRGRSTSVPGPIRSRTSSSVPTADDPSVAHRDGSRPRARRIDRVDVTVDEDEIGGRSRPSVPPSVRRSISPAAAEPRATRARPGRAGRRSSSRACRRASAGPAPAQGLRRTPTSWLTRTIAPGHARQRLAIAVREGGSRLFVGSSSSSRFFRPATSCASASFVFSPPESVPASWNATSPLRPNMPEERPQRLVVASAEAAFMCASTSTPSRMPSCSCA